MSDIGRRHSSKWDPPERNKSPKDLYDSAHSSRMKSSFHDRDVPRRHLPNDADVGMHSRRTSSGRKDFQMDETLNERSSSRDRDGKYTARISPSRDERRQRNRSRSPRDKIRSYRDSRSRSRSHSPGNGYRHEQIEGSRNRVGFPQSCRDFTAGRCRKGNHCQFSHSDQSYDRNTGASKYSSASSRYAQYEVTSDRKGSMDVMVKDGDNDRRRGDDLPGRSDDNDTVKDRDDDRRRHPAESGWSNDREHSRSGDLICKFFAAGRCRHGKYCRNSHNLQEVAHPDGARASDHNFDGANQAWKGATWDDPIPDVSQAKDWPEDKKEILDVTKPGDTAWKSRVEPRMPRNNLESVSEVWRDAARDDTVGHVSQSNGGPEGNRENLDTMRPTQRSHAPENNLERTNEAWHGATWNDTMGDVSQAKGWPEGNDVSFDTMNPSHMLRVPNHNPDVVSREWLEVTRDDTLGNASQEKGWLERKGENLDGMKLIRSSRPESDFQNMDLVSKGHTAVAGVPSGELASNDGKLPHQWKSQVTVNDVGVTVLKGAESSFSNMGNLASGGFGQQGLPISRPESVLLPHAYVHSRQLEVTGHSTTEKQYAAADSQPRVFDQPYSKMPTSTVGVSSAYPAEYSYHGSYTSSNTSTGILPGQGGGYTSNSTTISGLTARGVDQPAVSLDPFTETSHISKNLGGNLSDAPYMASVNLPQHALSQSPVIPEQLLAQLIENKDLITKLYAAQQGTSDGISGVSNSLSSEKPQESSHFSITQAQNFVNNTQVPVPYAAFNQHGAMESLSTVNDSMASVQYASASAFQSGEKQYDPLSDSVDPKQLNADGQLLSIEGGAKSSILQSSMVSTFAVEPASTITASGLGHDLSEAPAAVVKVERNGSPIERNDEPVENGPTDEMAVDAGANDGKKGKEAKGLRAFKFALAEFVKELLKPTWKEGHIGKEVYKTIVKKVVDKVLDTVQAAHIPQTKEKIDHYLSLSKLKLSKLVQAYVEKYQKS